MHALSETDTFDSTVTVVDDSDIIIPTSASLVVAYQSLADRTRWLKNRTGEARLATEDRTQATSTWPSMTVRQTWSTAATFGTVFSLRSPVQNFDGLSNFVPASGDVVEVDFTGTIQIQPTGSPIGLPAFAQMKLQVSFDGGSTWFDMVGAAQSYCLATNELLQCMPAHLCGHYLITSGATLAIGIVGRTDTTALTATLEGEYSVNIRVYRSNA